MSCLPWRHDWPIWVYVKSVLFVNAYGLSYRAPAWVRQCRKCLKVETKQL